MTVEEFEKELVHHGFTKVEVGNQKTFQGNNYTVSVGKEKTLDCFLVKIYEVTESDTRNFVFKGLVRSFTEFLMIKRLVTRPLYLTDYQKELIRKGE